MTHNRPSLISLVDRAVILRAGIAAAVLGTILTLANQFDAVFGVETLETLPLMLVFLTPFAVVALSQTFGKRQALTETRPGFRPHPSGQTLFGTALAHGIPRRAMLLGLVAGSMNTSIVVMATLLERASLTTLPGALIAQAFLLPMLFGLLSQTIAYRRAAQVISTRPETDRTSLSH